jgi:lysyl-tRNA synthetase class 2
MGFARRSLLSVRPIRHILHKLQQIRFNPYVAPDLYSPTTGRWLWNELRKQQEHTRKFYLKALEHVIIKAAGSKAGATAVRFEKLAESASNKVFLAVVGKQRLIVKIPDPVVPPRLVTASEVATLEFVRSELAVPVPKVLTWSGNNDNPVGCEYIIMEEAQGRALKTVWSHLGIPEKLAVVDEVLSIQKQLLTTKHMFSWYGCL